MAKKDSVQQRLGRVRPPRVQLTYDVEVGDAIVKKELQINASLYTLLQILSVSVFEKTELSSAFQGNELTTDLLDSANQLNLFGI